MNSIQCVSRVEGKLQNPSHRSRPVHNSIPVVIVAVVSVQLASCMTLSGGNRENCRAIDDIFKSRACREYCPPQLIIVAVVFCVFSLSVYFAQF